MNKRLSLTFLIFSFFTFSSNALIAESQTGFFDRDTKITCGVAALIGGALGAAIKDSNREKGALYGSVVAGGACVAIKYYSKRIRSSNQVAKDYFLVNKALPKKTKVSVYNIGTDTKNGRVVRGGRLVVNSLMNIIQGASDRTLDISETIFVFDKRNGNLIDSFTQKINSERKDGGELGNSYAIDVEDKLRPGQYDIRTVLSINGTHTKSNDLTITVI